MIKAILIGIIVLILICFISIAYSCLIISSYCSREEEMDYIDYDDTRE